MKKIALICCFGLFFAVPFLTGSPAGAQETFTFNFSQFVPETHPVTQQCQAWARQIEIRSMGTVKFKHYPASTLLKPEDTWDGVVKGVADIGNSVFAYSAGRFPVMSTLDLPLPYVSALHAATSAVAFYKKMQPEETKSAKVLYVFAHGPGFLHTNKPIDKLEDLKGLRIRATGMTAKLVSALGCVPVAMPQTEVYNALKKNIVDGNITVYEPLKSLNQASVIKYTIETPATAFTAGFYTVMNLEKWNSLPAHIKHIFEEVSEEAPAMMGKTWDDYDVIAKQYSLSLGNKVIKLSDQETERWQKAVEPVRQEYAKLLTEKGLKGEEIVNAAQAVIREQAKLLYGK